MANSSDSEEIREMGLTTPDKPVAKRSSTVPIQGRIAKKRTNMGRPRFAPIDAIAHATLCSPHPHITMPLPYLTLLYVFTLHPCSSACPDTSHGSKSPESPNSGKKKKMLTDMHWRF